jgi:hypothetical protein
MIFLLLRVALASRSRSTTCPDLPGQVATFDFESMPDLDQAAETSSASMLEVFDRAFGVCGTYFSSSATVVRAIDQGGRGNFCSGYANGVTSGSNALAFIDEEEATPAIMSVYCESHPTYSTHHYTLSYPFLLSF